MHCFKSDPFYLKIPVVFVSGLASVFLAGSGCFGEHIDVRTLVFTLGEETGCHAFLDSATITQKQNILKTVVDFRITCAR